IEDKNFAIVYIYTSITLNTYKTIVSKQKEYGSLELSESIIEESEVLRENSVNMENSSTTNKALQYTESNSWWWKDKASEYLLQAGNVIVGGVAAGSLPVGGLTAGGLTVGGLTVGGLIVGGLIVGSLTVGSLIVGSLTVGGLIGGSIGLVGGNSLKNMDTKESLKRSDTHVINRASKEDNIPVNKFTFTKEILLAVHEGLRSFVNSETAHIICSAQQDDGSFTLHSFITDHLGIKSVDVTKSLRRFVGSPQLRECNDSVWHTAFTIYYFRVVLMNHKKEWHHVYDRANKWLSKQIKGTKLKKKLFSACKQYLIEK
ncbi:25351_t:CDS:1, partial [Racocetra persica]